MTARPSPTGTAVRDHARPFEPAPRLRGEPIEDETTVPSWQHAYRFGALVIVPPASLRERVNALRERYDPESARIAEAHITVTQPLTEALSAGVTKRLAARCREEAPFEIAVGPVRTFSPDPIVWLDIQPADRILRLRHDLHALGPFNLSLPHSDDFVPHMTVAEGLSGPPVDDAAIAAIGDAAPGGTFVCDHIVLLVPDAAFRFRPETVFSFAAA